MINPADYNFDEISTREAIEIQDRLQQKMKLTPLDKQPTTVGGADVSFNRGSDTVFASIVTLALPGLEPVAHSLYEDEAHFPYIPGLLAFREVPVLLKAWESMRVVPDVLVMDGHGLAHPRRMGLATHFGILTDHPSVGCAKNILVGEYEEPGLVKGNRSPIILEGEQVGVVLRSRTNVNPVFVSPGHKIDIESSVHVIEQALSRYRLPETTRVAHKLVNELRRGEKEPGYVEY